MPGWSSVMSARNLVCRTDITYQDWYYPLCSCPVTAPSNLLLYAKLALSNSAALDGGEGKSARPLAGRYRAAAGLLAGAWLPCLVTCALLVPVEPLEVAAGVYPHLHAGHVAGLVGGEEQ